MVELVFGMFFIAFGLVLIYYLALAAFYFVRAVFEAIWDLITWPFREPEGISSGSTTNYVPPHTSRPAPTWTPEPESRYTHDWAKVSRKHKDAQGWRCDDCGVYCGGSKSDRRLLHVHHRDMDPQNNAPWNLESLCVVCHSERPGTGHRRLAGAITSDGRRGAVERLRRFQGQ
jgi:hypothetical protein